jgi:hypothetical protein
MDDPYLEVISYAECLHRQFLEVVKLELKGFGIHDINNVQAMMLFNIGDAEMTVGELTLRGCYSCDLRTTKRMTRADCRREAIQIIGTSPALATGTRTREARTGPADRPVSNDTPVQPRYPRYRRASRNG